MNAKDLAITLARLETEDDIVSVLRNEGYWDSYAFWRPFGDMENNFSIIGNQQSKADAALVEKLINSVDAILMKDCLKLKIDPTSVQAPQSMADALQKFYGAKNGHISSLDVEQRNRMSNDIILAATGGKRNVNFVIADKGEGQTPNSMPNTILSLGKSNKLKVPFVQGKFNMGGTGVLPFCGNYCFQLIISRRCPDIADMNDPTYRQWSITIVRREPAREQRRSSMYTYLTDRDGNVMKFDAESIDIIPTTKKTIYDIMEYGTFIKLFNYEITGYKSNILFDFNYRMSMLIPDLAHPIRLRECRDYAGHTMETTLSGLLTRLKDDRQDNIENGFPDSNSISVWGQTCKYSIYLFKQVLKQGRLRPTSENYREDDGILFVVNGQTHASISDSIFKKINLSYLADSLLVIVDCSDIETKYKEDMFMNSRDRLRNGQFSRAVESALREFLKEHDGLKRIQNERRAAAIHDKIGNDKPLQDALQNILSKSPVLSKILFAGTRLTSPFDFSGHAEENKPFKGKRHPTFFKIKGKLYGDDLKKKVPINHRIRVQFETDAENDYFVRDEEPGELALYSNEGRIQYNHLGLFNGIATLTLDMPDNAKIGTEYKYEVKIIDDYVVQDFASYFTVIPSVAVDDSVRKSKPGKHKPPASRNNGGDRQQPEKFTIPNIIEVYKDDWDIYAMNEKSALSARMTDEATDFYINMDNIYLLTELKPKNPEKDQIIKARYKYSMALIGMSVLSYYKNNPSNDDDFDLTEEINKVSSMLSPIVIPMLDALSELDIEDIAS